jgi:Glycosyl transferase family 2/Polysaccharide pyruvyl transferase
MRPSLTLAIYEETRTALAAWRAGEVRRWRPMPSLLATPGDRQRLADAESALFLVGSYDGSGNYGDVLQLAGAIATASRLPGSPLVVAVIERETRGHHDELARRYGELFGDAVIAFFADEGGDADGDLVSLGRSESRFPAGALVHLYGGGYLNKWWGARKAAHVAAVEELTGGRPPRVASGLQIEEEAAAKGGVAHDLLADAAWVSVRDAGSLEHARRHIPSLAGRVELAGDDALPFLTHPPIETGPIVNLHVNDGSWISDEPESLRRRIVALIEALGAAVGEPLELQPVIAYEDPRVSERGIVAALLERHREEIEAAGLGLAEPLDVLEDAAHNELASFRRARLTLSCSYHVSLTSLLAGIPVVLLAQNEYYGQKAHGLRDLFALEPGRVGISGEPGDAAAAVEALVEGPARTALIAHLRDRSEQVSARFERSRAALAVALAGGQRQSALTLRSEVDRRRADAAERELSAVRATRGWRLLNRLRAARHPFRSRPAEPLPPPPPPDAPAELRAEIGRIGHLIAEARGRGDYALEVARDASLPAKMLAFMSWLELRPPESGPPVSVVLPTRNRPEQLARALPSVLAQRYERWQLVVVDDGTDPGTRAVVEAVDDERVALVEGPQQGASAARNAGLDRASGEVVCYLDDDNVMHPGWLQAVAQVFSTRVDVDVAYGISLAEHRIPDDPGEHGWWPSFWQLPWSRETLLEENVTDISSIAHRRALDGARFDEEVSSGEDWDLLLRLTRERDALAVPALSHAYTMEGEDRMSRDPQHRAKLEQIRRDHNAG